MSRNPDFLLILALESSSGNCNLPCCGRRASPGIGRVCTAVPAPASNAAGSEPGKAVLRAQEPLRELVGVFGLFPLGDNMLAGGGAHPSASLHRAPSMGKPSLAGCCREALSAKCCPQAQLQHRWRLSPVFLGCFGTRPAVVLSLISGFGFCSAVRVMESCWGEEWDVGCRFSVDSPQISLHTLKE